MKRDIKATLAIAKADLKATFRNGSSVFFGILFPMIFIAVFGFIGGGEFKYEVGLPKSVDRENPVYKTLEKVEVIEFVKDKSDKELTEALKKGEIVAILHFQKSESNPNGFLVKLQKSGAEPQDAATVESILTGVADKLNLALSGVEQPPIELQSEVVAGRKFKQIDFVLPGQLGFGLLSTGVFGTSFLFVNLRQTLVIKRFFATPAKKFSIVVGLGISKLIFALIQALVIIMVGKYAFGYTLVHGVETLLAMLFLSMMGLAIFLGFGFIISSIAKDENAVPPIANLITMPQFLLAGTFFPVEAFPEWLQPVSKILPLTYLNTAMRQVAFEGVSLFDLQKELLFLVIAGVVVYAVAIKVFKWEA